MGAVERLGTPYWPPYLAGKTAEDFRYGANFAVGSATALNQDFFKKKHLNVDQITPYSLAVQIGWFQKLLAMLDSTDNGNKNNNTSLFSFFFFVPTIGFRKSIIPKILFRKVS